MRFASARGARSWRLVGLPRGLLTTVVLVAALAGARPSSASIAHPDLRAEALVRAAERHLAENTFDARREALRELEQATLIDRNNPGYELLLARTYLRCGFIKASQHRFERVAALAPNDADGRYGLGQVWRRDWLKYLEPASLDHAIEHFAATVRLDPTRTDAWVQLVPLYVQRGDLEDAVTAGAHALANDPQRPDAMLARAHAAFRTGDVALADSLFRAALPRLPKLARERFEDIAPVATAEDTFHLHRLSLADQKTFIERFWRDNDPDVATPENEARLEYWSRVAQAYFLYFDTKRREWDERGEVYVRYGPPDRILYNPLPEVVEHEQEKQKHVHDLIGYGDATHVSFSAGMVFPANAQLWEYPRLGMSVVLQDRLLQEYYLLPITRDYDPDPVPDPDSLVKLGDQLATASGRGVFPKLPPGVKSLEVHGAIARFLGERGPRLLADVASPGAPSDSLWAEWAVLDSTRRQVDHGTAALGPSACDPSAWRVAQMGADLPPGEYLVGLTVHAPGARRGIYRTEIEIPPVPRSLVLSDLVVACGPPAVGGRGVTIEPNPQARVAAGAPLTVYFEIYHLTPDSTGEARFQYETTVRSTGKDPRIWIQRMLAPRSKIPEVSASREATNTGALRRQFVTVPVESLPAGTYRLELKVRDLIAGVETVRTADFTRLPLTPRN